MALRTQNRYSLPMPFELSFAARAWLAPILDRFRPLAKDAAALSFFINLLGLAAPVFVLQIYDRVVFRAGIGTLAGLTIGMVIACAFEFILRQARAKMMQRVALTIDVEVGRAVFDKVLAVPLHTLESRPTAYWKLLFRDVEMVRNTLSGPTALLAVDAPFSLLFLLLIFIIAWPVAWVLVAILACFVALSWRSGHAVSGAAAREMTAAVQRDAKLEELLAQRATVKSLAMGGRLREVWEDAQHGTITQSIARGGEADTAGSLGQLLTVVATVAMTAVGALAIIDQNLTIGGLIAANMLAGRLLAPMNQLVGAWRGYTSFKQSADRLADAFTLTDDLHHSPVALVRPRGRIELDKLHFGYPGQAVIIEDLDLTIEHGGIHGILGLNGSGKTTLLKLIMGLYRPIKGRVLLDGADIAQFARDDLARWIGFVPQDCVLLGGTIRENIALGRPHATDEEIVHAATLAQAHAAIAALPKGYGTAVGEGGSQLSGGMRQRISIARALLGDPPVIVMDEPTSSLDRQAEEGLKDALAALAAKHTIILVTHSPVLLQACQRLVVLEAGRIAAQGAPAAVMAALAKQRQAGGVMPLTQSAS
jgi:ATP-binding cassette, subfamily C, bacterial LapB